MNVKGKNNKGEIMIGVQFLTLNGENRLILEGSTFDDLITSEIVGEPIYFLGIYDKNNNPVYTHTNVICTWADWMKSTNKKPFLSNTGTFEDINLTNSWLYDYYADRFKEIEIYEEFVFED